MIHQERIGEEIKVETGELNTAETFAVTYFILNEFIREEERVFVVGGFLLPELPMFFKGEVKRVDPNRESHQLALSIPEAEALEIRVVGVPRWYCREKGGKADPYFMLAIARFGRLVLRIDTFGGRKKVYLDIVQDPNEMEKIAKRIRERIEDIKQGIQVIEAGMNEISIKYFNDLVL